MTGTERYWKTPNDSSRAERSSATIRPCSARTNGRRALIPLLVVVCAAALVGCDDDPTSPRASPVAPAGFAPGDFVNLPKPGSAKPLDAPAETETTVTQSFDVSGLGPRGVMEFYARELPPDGWIPRRVDDFGRTTLRGSWARGDQLLEVAAFAADGVESTGPSQLDLVLRFRGAERR
jgi:hypothetical protein